jgi:hypothetical protein
MDKNELLAGELLYEELTNAITQSHVILACISKEYLKSNNCRRELVFASEHNKHIIPILMCEDKRTEFGTWPCSHQVFFLLAGTLYIADIYKPLKNCSFENKPFTNFLDQLENVVKTKP